MQIRKLNSKGLSHVLALIAVIVLAGIGGTWALVGSHAATASKYIQCSNLHVSSKNPAKGSKFTVQLTLTNKTGKQQSSVSVSTGAYNTQKSWNGGYKSGTLAKGASKVYTASITVPQKAKWVTFSSSAYASFVGTCSGNYNVR